MRMSDPFASVTGDKPKRRSAGPDFAIVIPVPPGVTLPPKRHPTLGRPTQIWTYTDAAGQVLGFVWRFDGKEGKQFRPLTLWHPVCGGNPVWRWKSWPPPRRPLYGLGRLAERVSAPVIVTEGEKAADAASRLLTGFVVISAPNGA